ncbi:MAG: hypothetical protein ABSE49_27835 [Polyangiaceae bacterium]|jgi:hypothetical protein
MNRVVPALAIPILVALGAGGCDPAPSTSVVLDNDYPPYAAAPLVVYRAYWQAVTFNEAVAPGDSSPPLPTVAASDNTAYVLLAPGWDPAGTTAPASFILLQSREGYAVDLGDTLHIPIDDSTFAGNCATGSTLTQAQADFIAQLVFVDDSGAITFRYDAATCTTTLVGGDAGSSDAGTP